MQVPGTSDSPPNRLPSGRRPAWRESLRRAIRDAATLCRQLRLPESVVRSVEVPEFPLLVPREFAAKMRPGDARDPLLLQVLPQLAERQDAAGFRPDPVGDRSAWIAPGILQKYAGRALLVATGVCAVHCRYCFRRHFPYQDTPPDEQLWLAARERLRRDPTIDEVILSGGDPLMLADTKLSRLVDLLAEVPHVQRLRIHTRLPIVIPSRVTSRLLRLLQTSRLTPIVVVHANHPQELGSDVLRALAAIVDAGIPVLNQAVLLRHVNDSVEALEGLCRTLVDHRVLPYYLHQLDRVRGAHHFEVAESTGIRLIDQLRRRLPGYAVPQYVRETAGEPGKTPL